MSEKLESFPIVSYACICMKRCAHLAYISTCALLMIASVSGAQDVPYFADRLNNVTVTVGRNATFHCIVGNLKAGYQIAWFHKDKHTLLALQDSVIYRNGRLSVSTHDRNTFFLHIHDVREEDRGQYMCQINTDPMKSQIGVLQVVVPPKLIERLTSSDIEVTEDSAVSLRCAANGFPEPHIKWRREDGQPIHMQNIGVSNIPKFETVVNGEYLNLTKVTRLHTGAYICIASNGIATAVSKRIFLSVNFSPLIWTPNQSIGASLGSDITLECNLESYPKSKMNWTRNGLVIMNSNDKYNIYVEQIQSHYRTEMRLKIMNIKQSDYGSYGCVAKNGFGEAEGTIRLFETPNDATQTDIALYSTKFLSTNEQKKFSHGNRNSYSFEDNKEERRQNKAIILPEILSYEITSEHITLQSEDRVTHNSYNHKNGSLQIKSIHYTSIILISFLLNIFLFSGI